MRAGLFIGAALFAMWHAYVGQPVADFVVRVGCTFVFGLTAGVVALRQGHLGGAIALHVVWNVFIDLGHGLQNWPNPFWDSFAANWNLAFSFEDLQDRESLNALMLPLLLETTLAAAICRETIRKIFAPP